MHLRSQDQSKYEWLSPFEDNTHLPRSAREQFTNNYFDKYDPLLRREVEDSGFKSLAIKDGDGNVLGYEYNSWGSRAGRYYKLSRLRLAVQEVLECLYAHCPVDTGFGITHGIRYELTNSGAKIVIGRGIAEYLVHQSYPRTKNLENSAQNSPNMGWIDIAVAEARVLIKGYGFKLMKDHLHFGSMQLYLVRFASASKSINNIYVFKEG